MIAGSQTNRERGNAPDREQDNEQQLHPIARVELLLFACFVGLLSHTPLEAGEGAAKDTPPPGRAGDGKWGNGLPYRVMKRMRMVATWARLASPWGSRVPAPVPVHRPVSTAQAMALWA